MVVNQELRWVSLTPERAKEFLSNPALIGKDIESVEYGNLYRGPINEIRIDDWVTIIASNTSAFITPLGGDWISLGGPSSWGGLLEQTQFAQEAGKVFISNPRFGVLTIYPLSCRI